MLKCKYLGYNERILFWKIINEKYQPGKERLLGVYNTVVDRYQVYLENFENVGVLTDSPFTGVDQKTVRDALHSCYGSETETFAEVRGRIFSIQPEPILSLCPYCLLSWPDTIDHYVGKADFPEFSILCKNMIPCCGTCNTKKDEKWRENGRRRIIHFYNDTFFDQQFLRARLIYTAGGIVPKIEYYLERPGTMSVEDFQIVQWHFEDLELIKKYNQRAGPTFSAEYAAFKAMNQDDTPVDKIRRMLLKKYAGHVKEVCLNYYVAVIYETLANDATFLASLNA